MLKLHMELILYAYAVWQGGYYWFNLIDVFIGGFPLLIIGLVEIIALIYIYGW